MIKNEEFQPTDPAVIPRFSDVATFLRSRRHNINKAIDVGLVGVPFDLGVHYRTGGRQGPAGVREASRVIRLVHPTSGIRPFEITNVADIGDCPINPVQKDKSIKNIQSFFSELKDNAITPIAIGGDHTIPLPILRALATDHPVGILHVDAHADVLDSLSEDRNNNATFMRVGLEEGLIDPTRVVQIGMRGSRYDSNDIQYSYDAGYTVITMDEYEEMGRKAVIEKIDEVLGDDGSVYITIDIDGLDPSFMPGTPVPEIGGITPRDMQVILRSLQGKKIIGADICEIAPCFDPTGITCVSAANLMFEILCVTAYWLSNKKSSVNI